MAPSAPFIWFRVIRVFSGEFTAWLGLTLLRCLVSSVQKLKCFRFLKLLAWANAT